MKSRNGKDTWMAIYIISTYRFAIFIIDYVLNMHCLAQHIPSPSFIAAEISLPIL